MNTTDGCLALATANNACIIF